MAREREALADTLKRETDSKSHSHTPGTNVHKQNKIDMLKSSLRAGGARTPITSHLMPAAVRTLVCRGLRIGVRRGIESMVNTSAVRVCVVAPSVNVHLSPHKCVVYKSSVAKVRCD